MTDPAWDDSRTGAYLRALPDRDGDIALGPTMGGLCSKSLVATDGGGGCGAHIGGDIPVLGVVPTAARSSSGTTSEIAVSPNRSAPPAAGGPG